MESTSYTFLKRCNNCGCMNEAKNNVCIGCGFMMVTREDKE